MTNAKLELFCNYHLTMRLAQKDNSYCVIVKAIQEKTYISCRDAAVISHSMQGGMSACQRLTNILTDHLWVLIWAVK